MEQKKILWIVVAVSVFLLIIFGTALFLYAPSRSTGPALQQNANNAPAYATPGNAGTTTSGFQTSGGQASGVGTGTLQSGTNVQVDPDAWVKDPAKAPGLDTLTAPSQGNINLTIVNGENAAANYNLDVNGLSRSNPPIPATQNQTGVVPTASGTQATANSQATQTPAKPATAASTTTKTTTATAAVAAKPVAKPLVTVTEYWIQTGSFSSKLNAEKARDSLKARYLNAEIFTKDIAGATTYRVRVGPYKNKAEAEYWLGTVKEIPDFATSSVWEVKTKK